MTDLTLVAAWKAAQSLLKEAKIDQPAIDARLLLEAATGVTRVEIITDPYRLLTREHYDMLTSYLERRAKREPVARILGRKGFWTLMFNLTPDVLVPRPETECIVDMVLKTTSEHERFRLLDMGVGSGAILLAILAERPAAIGLGTDISEEALCVSRDNAANFGLSERAGFLRTSWGQGLGEAEFDFVVSNPPYIKSNVIDSLSDEVKHHDPLGALDGGHDGLDAYRDAVPDAFRLLKMGGQAWFEIGYDQSDEVEALFKHAGFSDVVTYKDLSNLPRIVYGVKKSLASA